MNIRQKLNNRKLSKEDRQLREAGITESSSHGPSDVLTDVGRRIVLDFLFQDEDMGVRASIVEALNEVKQQELEDAGDETLGQLISKAVKKIKR